MATLELYKLQHLLSKTQDLVNQSKQIWAHAHRILLESKLVVDTSVRYFLLPQFTLTKNLRPVQKGLVVITTCDLDEQLFM